MCEYTSNLSQNNCFNFNLCNFQQFPKDTSACLDCIHIEPPNAILSIPPPPLPAFLLPKSADLILPGNNLTQPCYAADMCNHSPGVSSDHIDYIELNRNSNLGIEEPWFFVVICSLCIILFVSAILSIILLKCRDSNCSFHDSNLKQHQMTYPKEREQNVNAKNYHQSFGIGGVGGNNQLMPAYNPPLPVLWAQLTPHGTTQHFISEPYPQDNHYEAIEYNNRQAFAACVNDLNKSFKTTRKTTTSSTMKSSSKVNYSISHVNDDC